MKKSFFILAFLIAAACPVTAVHAGVLEELQETYNTVAAKASKAVVSVQVVREEAQKVVEPEYFFGYVIPQERIYRHQTAGIGSGVIINSRGYVLTNYHVVEDAVDIKITMKDENGTEKTYMAGSVASDPALDIALLKVKEGGEFPFLELNYSEKLSVGNMVMAVGYPFGFKQTVTSGIISALNAKLPVNGKRYEHLIQTDAAINPGNSGGPLLNLKGEVIGINTAIASPSGAFAGMGFAVPSTEIKPVLDDMLAGRKIRRGWLGVSVLGIDRIIAAQLGMPKATGVIVNQVVYGSPAWKAGIERGDIIIACNDSEINSADSMVLQTFSRRPGEKITLEIIHNGKRKTVKAVLGDREQSENSGENDSASVSDSKTAVWEGVELEAGPSGAKVMGLRSGSGLKGHLMRGDIISSVNGVKINSSATLKKAFNSASLREGVLFDIVRNGHPSYISVQSAR
ncbi:MAG: trypsin-like peptidase domain-containing protein [Elusimicrobiales bacterium]|nr:trypsin-like peptidase domain-containing protein [Elusimicrobiales bacterium]